MYVLIAWAFVQPVQVHLALVITIVCIRQAILRFAYIPIYKLRQPPLSIRIRIPYIALAATPPFWEKAFDNSRPRGHFYGVFHRMLHTWYQALHLHRLFLRNQRHMHGAHIFWIVAAPIVHLLLLNFDHIALFQLKFIFLNDIFIGLRPQSVEVHVHEIGFLPFNLPLLSEIAYYLVNLVAELL